MSTADTRDRILDAAEALFARQGFSATSLRAVIAEAGVNLAAVHYHFGPREELVRAVFARRFDPINAERMERFAALPPGPPARGQARRRAEDILSILVGPLLRVARESPGDWSLVSVLVGRAHTDPDFVVRRILHDQFREVFQKLTDLIQLCFPELGEEELTYRLHFVIAAMAVSIVHGDDVRVLSEGRIDPARDPEVFARRWVAFAVAGLAAEPTALRGVGE